MLEDLGGRAVRLVLRPRELHIEFRSSAAGCVVPGPVVLVLGLHGVVVVAAGVPVDEAR